ncbi:hypothetical protein NKH23_31620 [Mesorhizobium sp. M1328]|uniref:hypothetical protein n=1 Tax=Mesorhizobium sp. M1328 TaxID=2957082 RepID=UPI00333C17BE
MKLAANAQSVSASGGHNSQFKFDVAGSPFFDFQTKVRRLASTFHPAAFERVVETNLLGSDNGSRVFDHGKQAVKGGRGYLQPPAQCRDVSQPPACYVRRQSFSLLPPTV